MIKQATKGIILLITLILIVPTLVLAQDHSKLAHQINQPIITQDDFVDYFNLHDQGLMTSKELIEFDRLLNDINSNPKKMDYRSVRLIDLSHSNRNLK